MSGLDEQKIPKCPRCVELGGDNAFWTIYRPKSQGHPKLDVAYLDIKPIEQACVITGITNSAHFVWEKNEIHRERIEEYNLEEYPILGVRCNAQHNATPELRKKLLRRARDEISKGKVRWE
jgi:hypothetical protein